jgi:hypothetical protein
MDKRWRFFRNIAASLLDSVLAARAGCRWIFAEGLNKKHTTSPSGDIAVRARCPDQIVNMGLGTASAIKPLATFHRKSEGERSVNSGAGAGGGSQNVQFVQWYSRK